MEKFSRIPRSIIIKIPHTQLKYLEFSALQNDRSQSYKHKIY